MISVAIDLSGQEVSLAVAPGSENIFSRHRPMKGREAAQLLPWIVSSLGEHGFALNDVGSWIVGTGPGSFTGLRLVSSLVAGIIYGKEITAKGIPSACAYAVALNPKNDFRKTAVLYDGRHSQILFAGFDNPDDYLHICEKGEFGPDGSNVLGPYERFAAGISDKAALEKILPEHIMKNVKFFEHFPIAEFFTVAEKNPVAGNIEDLVYMRPSVFVQPVEARKI